VFLAILGQEIDQPGASNAVALFVRLDHGLHLQIRQVVAHRNRIDPNGISQIIDR